MNGEARKKEIATEIQRAFVKRSVPVACLRMPVAGDDQESEFSVEGHVRLKILGKEWREVRAVDFVHVLHYLSTEAFCYYLPAILIDTLETEDCFDDLDMYLEPFPGRLGLAGERIRQTLDATERLAVAEYMDFMRTVGSCYGEDAVLSWRL